MRRTGRSLLYLLNVAVVVDLATVHAAWIGHYDLTDSTGRLIWMAVYVVTLSLGVYASGLADPPERLSEAVWAAGGTVAGSAGVISFAQLLLGSQVLPRFVVFGTAAVLGPAYVGLARLGDRLRRRHEGLDRVVAVVGAREAVALRAELGRAPERPATLAAVLDVESAGTGASGGLPLVEAATATRATVVVLDRAAQLDESVVAQAALLHGRGLRVRTLALFYDEWLGKLPIGELEQVSLMFDIQEVHARRYARLKRFADVAVAVAGLALLVPAVPLVAVADLVGNRGPLLYRQRRVGRGGQEFTMLKFRTMAPEGRVAAQRRPAGVVGGGRRPGPDVPAAAGGAAPGVPAATAGAPLRPEVAPWTEVGDPRLGRVGRWMRRVHVDELPQLLNVLRGDLSIVGPRPEQPCYVGELREKIPFYDVRHLVHPGLTGWAQVKFHYGASVADALEKLQYEFFYLRHQGLALDARIVARTLRSVLAGRGR